jgi:hypothetical protein
MRHMHGRAMHLPTLLTTLAVLAVAFAGCSDGGGDGDGQSSSSTSTSKASTSSSTSGSGTKSATATSSSSSTGTTGPSNQPPSGSVSAAINGTEVTFSLAGSDADGDELSWTLDFGDETDAETGTTLPANATHTYAVGNYTANFTLDDGTATKSYEVEVAVTAAGGPQQVVYAAEVTVFCEHCSVVVFETGAFVPSASLASGEQGFDAIWLEITPEMVGLPFTITSTGGDPDAVALDACAPDAGQIEAYGEGPEAGVIPPGAACLVTWEFETPMSTITMTVG